MPARKSTATPAGNGDHCAQAHDATATAEFSRRVFLKSGAAGLAAGALTGAGLSATVLAQDSTGTQTQTQTQTEPPAGPRILLKGGVVLSLDAGVGDFSRADILIDGSTIAAIAPDIEAEAQVVDASGMIVMPGFIDTHHHQYETIQRGILADGSLGSGYNGGDWPQESYTSVVQQIWTAGLIPGAGEGAAPVWDLGRSPYDPEDCYISELVASVSQIDQGITTGVDTSQSSHTPEHTDAMIQGLMDSGRRSLFVYSPGRPDSPGYEFPGKIGDSNSGLGRLRKQFFNSDDQLVTLGFRNSGPDNWALARSFGAVINNHNNGSGQELVEHADLLDEDMTMVHCARFIPEAYKVCADRGVHVSIATLTESQMGHGTPPFQACLDAGILPSLSSDVDTNNTPDPFSLMRSAFTLQRVLLHARYLAGEQNLPPLLTSYQVLQMATTAGARACRLHNKVGTLTPGKQADIVMLNARRLNTWPLNNAPGAVVTLMDTSSVDTVFIAGKVRKWRGRLVGVDVEKLLNDIEASRDRVLARIKAVPIPVDGLHTAPGYTPNPMGSCCIGDPV